MMAGPLSSAAREKSLQNDFGPTRGPNSPDSFLMALYTDDPEFGGVELDSTSCPGYARASVDNDDFALVDGLMEVSVPLADATAAWTQIGKFALLLNAADTSEAWDYASVQQVRVLAAGPLEPVVFTVFYSDDSTTP